MPNVQQRASTAIRASIAAQDVPVIYLNWYIPPRNAHPSYRSLETSTPDGVQTSVPNTQKAREMTISAQRQSVPAYMR